MRWKKEKLSSSFRVDSLIWVEVVKKGGLTTVIISSIGRDFCDLFALHFLLLMVLSFSLLYSLFTVMVHKVVINGVLEAANGRQI